MARDFFDFYENIPSDLSRKLLKHGIRFYGSVLNSLNCYSLPGTVIVNEGKLIGMSLNGVNQVSLKDIHEMSSLVIDSLIQKLYICRAGLNEIPDWIGKIETLEELHLGENKISELSESIRNLPSIKIINANINCIQRIPQWIGELKSLEKVYLRKNRISDLPESMRKLSALKVINLNSNRIKEIPEWIGELESLEELYLSNNEISEFPESLQNLTSLRLLHLSNNNITKIPIIHNLREIDMSFNNIELMDLGEMTYIETAKLSNNDINVIPNDIDKCSNLTKLMLKQNS